MKNTIKKIFEKWRETVTLSSVFFFFVFQASTGYQIKAYEFGGGGANTSGGSYSIEGIAGQVAGQPTSASYQVPQMTRSLI